MDYDALRVEVAKPEYAGLTDAEVATVLESKVATMGVDVPIAKVESYLRLHGLVFLLDLWVKQRLPTLASLDASTMEAVVTAAELVNMIQSPRLTEFETSKPERLAALSIMLSKLVSVSAGGFAQPNKDDLLAMAQASVRLWPDVTARDVWIARGQPE